MTQIAPKIAAIDVGTNSFHLIVASVNNRGMIQIHAKEKESVRLGSSKKDMKYLQEDAMQRGLDTLTRFADIAKLHKADIRAVATSAVREAKNRKKFLDLIYENTGIKIEVVSGAEEARLIYMGVINALPVYDKDTLIIDIGGGSTETIIGNSGKIKYVNSEKIGAIRLTQRFFDKDKISKKDVNDCRDFIKGAWAPTMDRINSTGFTNVIGTSGTIQNLASITLSRNDEMTPVIMNGISLSGEDVLGTIKKLYKSEDVNDRSKISGLDSNRADIIVGGSLILEHAIKELNIKKLLISTYALREGIVFDTIQKMKAITEFRNLSNLRYQTVYHICQKYQVDLKHAEFVRWIVLRLFDDLKDIHKLGDNEREILEASALLHDIGYLISHDRHHKHSYYIIRNCMMPGFTNDEQDLIANIARYHRKSHPKKKHDNYSMLSKSQQKAVSVLAGMLRVAEGLDRRNIQILKDFDLNVRNSNIDFNLSFDDSSHDPDVEVWGAERRKPLLEQTLKVKIRFKKTHN